ncbi:hypothetical protein JXB31_04175 [Candidatus Woesearchaeota archaeon]|nr:hypothetical protein [Candidatus Woesearchaeota archaeon]
MLEEDYPLLYGIISLMFAIALVKAIMSIFGLFSGSGGGLFKNWGSGGKSSGGGGGSGNSNVNLNPLEKKIDGLQKVVNNMQGKMNEGFEEVSDEVGKVKKIAENIEALCKQIISHLDRFKDFFEKSCNIFEEYEKRFESFFKEITQALQTINTKQGANDMKIQARFDALTQIVSKNQAFLLEVKNSLHSLASNVNQGFKDIGDFFNTITGKINQAEPVMKEYKSKIDDLIKSFNGFNTRLDSIEKDIETINKKEEESKEAHANIITEINNGYKTISERLKNANDDILNLGKLGEKIEEDFIKKLESVKENIKTSIKQNAGQNRNMILGEIDKLFTSIEKIQNNPKVINPKVIIDHIEISTTILQSDKLLYKTMKESAELLEKWKETTKDAKSMIQFHEKLIEEDEDKIKKLSEVEKGLGDIMNKIEARLKEVLEALS